MIYSRREDVKKRKEISFTTLWRNSVGLVGAVDGLIQIMEFG